MNENDWDCLFHTRENVRNWTSDDLVSLSVFVFSGEADGGPTTTPTTSTAASLLLQLLTGPPAIQFLLYIIFTEQTPPEAQNLKRGKISLLARIGRCRGSCCHRRQLLARPGGAGGWWRRQTEASLRESAAATQLTNSAATQIEAHSWDAETSTGGGRERRNWKDAEAFQGEEELW